MLIRRKIRESEHTYRRMMLFFVLILCVLIQPSEQLLYSCNSTAVCGCSANSASVTRIVGGENAGESTWGWAVSIKIGNGYLCGGSIISSSWVITAAHCIVTSIPSQFIIYAGSLSPWTGAQTRRASRIIVHPSYNSGTYENDIALLKLESPLIMTDSTVSSICIPAVSSSLLSFGEWPSSDTTVDIYIFSEREIILKSLFSNRLLQLVGVD